MAIGGLSLPQILQGRSASGTPHKDTSVILLYLNGGPSHMETYDMKPEAPLAYRSVFPSIKTNVPGIDICELFPLQAKLADKLRVSIGQKAGHSLKPTLSTTGTQQRNEYESEEFRWAAPNDDWDGSWPEERD